MIKDKQSDKKQTADSPCVYILLCSDGTLYTGWTNNLKKRLSVHNSGKGAKYTRGRLPVSAVYVEFLPDKSSATRREAAIKKLSAEKKRQLIASDKNQLFMVSST
ncbi:MAG: GIY-YIG nuclease family protein [Anaerovoracaceae bacterium]